MTAQQEYTEHLLALKRAEVVSELERQGYRVELEHRLDSQKADLVASKPGAKTLVYEFELPGNLHVNSEQIRRLRRIAADEGFEFKLVVVTPPRRIDVSIEGLEGVLYNVLQERLGETSLSSFAGHVVIEDVTDVNITSLYAHGELTDVEGYGAVGVRIEIGGGEERDGVTSYDTFPFEFDLTLKSQHEVVEIRVLEVDTSSFYK